MYGWAIGTRGQLTAREHCASGLGWRATVVGEAMFTDPASVPRLQVLRQGSRIFDANDRLYAARVVGREIVVYDTGNAEILSRLGPKLGIEGPDDVAFGPDGSPYWTSILTGDVGRMTPDGIVTTQFIAPGVNPITFSDDGRLFVGLAFLGDALYEVDPDLQDPPRLIGEHYHLNGFDFGPDGYLYCPQLSTNSIVRINVDSGELETVKADLIGPAAVKFNSRGELHATEFAGGRLLKIDVASGELSGLAQFPASVDNLAFDSQDRLFVSHATDAFIPEVLADGTIRYVEQSSLRSPGALAILDDGDSERLFEADGFALREIDSRSGEQINADRIPLVLPGGVIAALTVAPDGENLLLTSWFSNQVQVWDPDQKVALAAYVDFNVPLNAIRFQGDLIVAEAGSGSVVRARGDDPTMREAVASDLILPLGLAATDDDLWVADWATGIIWQLVDGGETLTEPLLIVDGLVNPEGMTTDRDGALLVVESGAGRVVRIDPATGTRYTVVDGLETGLEAIPGTMPTWIVSGIAVDSQGTIFVSGDRANQIYRIDRP